MEDVEVVEVSVDAVAAVVVTGVAVVVEDAEGSEAADTLAAGDVDRGVMDLVFRDTASVTDILIMDTAMGSLTGLRGQRYPRRRKMLNPTHVKKSR